MKERRASEFTNLCDKGHVLLVALLLIFLLGVAGMTSLYLAGQDGLGVSAMKEDHVTQQLVSRSECHADIRCWIVREAPGRSIEWAVVLRRSRALAVRRDR